ncbi:Uncharacterized protein Fot_06285 [Forsythia ovata]|uniref:Uncharacterized protein n=1 Tax=Forsythia ovata TaxID=205694 RepID=A0ABD1WSX2_9LAMI
MYKSVITSSDGSCESVNSHDSQPSCRSLAGVECFPRPTATNKNKWFGSLDHLASSSSGHQTLSPGRALGDNGHYSNRTYSVGLYQTRSRLVESCVAEAHPIRSSLANASSLLVVVEDFLTQSTLIMPVMGQIIQLWVAVAFHSWVVCYPIARNFGGMDTSKHEWSSGLS